MGMKIYLAGGCFWSVQDQLNGCKEVVKTTVGYVNGLIENPTYQTVCAKQSGYAEAVEVGYSKSSDLEVILNTYIRLINPYRINENNQQIRDQYRNAIICSTEDQMISVMNYLHELDCNKQRRSNIEVEYLANFYQAEEEHQNYFEKNPNAGCKLSL